MQTVEAVKTEEERTAVEMMLKKYGGDLYSDIWIIGVNTALRITDLLSMKFSDLESGVYTLIEGKTKKARKIRLNAKALEVIARRKKANPDDVYLFQVHSNRSKNNPPNRSTVARMFKAVGDSKGLGIALGTHSMRKTRGYVMFNAGVPIEKICKMLNHSSTKTTLAYIGIEEEDVQKSYDEFNI